MIMYVHIWWTDEGIDEQINTWSDMVLLKLETLAIETQRCTAGAQMICLELMVGPPVGLQVCTDHPNAI